MNDYPTIVKKTSDVRLYSFDFADFPEVAAGAPILSAAVTADGSGLTVGTVTISGTKVKALISAGTAGTNYVVSCVATLPAGIQITARANFYVE